jgi:2-keto-4-pentenoate hydratase/2-oxohepta-3-ene-1,7-dioic acid hydratase in catechol pathway
MNASAQVLWIGRIHHDGMEHVVRVSTESGAPGPDDACEEIEDPFGDPNAEAWTRAQADPVPGGVSGRLGDFRLAAPVRARKVIGVGRNFRAHAEELGNAVPETPLLFFKAPTCLLASGEPIPLPRGYERIDMESELVVVIGRRAKNVDASKAWDHVAGYALGNDVSNRDLQRSDKQWTRAKGFDGFGPLGPLVRLTEPGWVLPTSDLRIRGYLDETRVQDASLDDMIFDIPTLMAHITQCMTLEPGDLVYTGTPAGVTALSPGNVCRVELSGLELGQLRNPVA